MKIRRVVDLIQLKDSIHEKVLVNEYRSKIDYWVDFLKLKQDLLFSRDFESDSEQVMIADEYSEALNLLNDFILKRLQWIEGVKEKELKEKYLRIFHPFQHQGGLRAFLFHFFQFDENEEGREFQFRKLNNVERELHILWDIYKVKRTIESIDTLIDSMNSSSPFPSGFKVSYRKDCLQSMKTVLMLLFQMCIRPEFHRTFLADVGMNEFTPQAILERKEKEEYYIYPHVLEKYDYRIQFFYLFFSSGMIARLEEGAQEFKFNFLDYEIIKQEFLIDWLEKRLTNNPKKNEVYSTYQIEGKSIFEILEQDPAKELQILKDLPAGIFNDLIAQVNDKLPPEEQTPVETFSEESGRFAREKIMFDAAKSIARFSVAKLRKFIGLPPSGKLKREPLAEKEASIVTLNKPSKPLDQSYIVIKLKKEEIDFPFFCKSAKQYPERYLAFKKGFGRTSYEILHKRLSKVLMGVSEHSLVQRLSPTHEWALPYMIKEKIGDKTFYHLLVLGAEIKAAKKDTDKPAKKDPQLNCYLVYGNTKEERTFGEVADKRKAKGMTFFEYEINRPVLVQKSLELFDLVVSH